MGAPWQGRAVLSSGIRPGAGRQRVPLQVRLGLADAAASRLDSVSEACAAGRLPGHWEEGVTVVADFEVRDPRFEQRVRASFDRQGLMHTLGAELVSVRPGLVDIEVGIRPELTQQHGYLHAGVVMSVVDTACGYAALTLAEPGYEVLSVEIKVNLLAPSVGTRVRATGRVVRSGRTLTVCQGDVYVVDTGKHVATVLTTMILQPLRD